ncbi:GEVED domain-containing protein [Chryseobacterium sp.]|uniref:GEVED domain-containing protein n=1 Tax=Chryseobacterium sp. TaxID=1871047 RepID=UPI0011CAE1C4|nr:GEVED domain-containing protein [Chryseobacterium sp.]TXF77512.1 T9SS type A sorting domain-containing protein [Chryseobacterium sp.]
MMKNYIFKQLLVCLALCSFSVGAQVVTYCIPTADGNDDTGITRVIFADLNNNAGGTSEAYTDFTSLIANVTAGNSYALSVNANTLGYYTDFVTAWIDWNNNHVFETGEAYDLGSATDVVDEPTSLSPLSIQIPSNTPPGQYRMRVRLRWDALPTPCDSDGYSEAEDYTLNVQAVTWNGTAWSNGTGPDAALPVVITSDYAGASFAAYSITLNAARTLTITDGNSVTVGSVTNNGSIVVEDGGNFLQTASGTYSGTGTFAANRNSASVANKYAFWSSPVAAANIYAVFPGFTPQYAMTYNTATDYYTVVPNPTATTAGFGYSVKIPATAPNLTFSGTPNNGSISKTLTLAGGNYNLVGNPYPSNLDLAAFYAANTANIASTLWFWDNTSNSVTTQSGSTTVNVGYATYNAAGSTWVSAPTSMTPSGNSAKIGQGFIVEALTNTLSFTNSMRVADAGVSVNKNVVADDGKYWLKLTTPYSTHFSQAVTYGQGASNAYDAYDSESIATGSDAFYSLAGPEKLVIQGRESFNVNDVVQLGNKHFETGTFTIALTLKEGLFANGQAVYLKDKLLGTETNLQNGSYTFASNAGDFTNRFEIVYKQSLLGTASAADKNDLKVYRSGNDFIIDSPEMLRSVEVYDASGRLVQALKLDAVQAAVTLTTEGVYVLKIKTDSATATKKIIK